ncbi:head-tail connector protein [Mycobacterium phage DroogsArmy]|uniref:Head-to-tail connector protein n=2 Tax=Timshelvirus TaxID=2948926 RepID=G1DB35_9CAUD|nr:head-tail connector protein [Mycobacterium phage Timshel]YP_010061971.1 head-tail connector protein [Mycobacterium phage DroogsArmy]AEJ92331.1 hypothetical protein TIMSHEL_17 [Mycobacterium phage Timshel]QKO02413.1 hypothetical protein SEA_DROOGSARMY_17 [Mycobacterium phage DroogsArmy]
MKVRNLQVGGTATVSDEYGARLIATGGWAAAEEKPKRKRSTKKVDPAPEPQPTTVEVPPTEE